MRYPNTRYGNPVEMQYYAQFLPFEAICKSLKRDERTVKDWLSGKQKIPFWVCELLRLRDFERVANARRLAALGLGYRGLRLAKVLKMKERPHKAENQPGNEAASTREEHDEQQEQKVKIRLRLVA